MCIFVISAPGASEPKNMIYMSRLGIWGEGTPFRTFDDFLHAIEKRFVPWHVGEFHSKTLARAPFSHMDTHLQIAALTGKYLTVSLWECLVDP